MRIIIAAAAAGALLGTGSALAATGAELFKSKGCENCHAADAKKVGPSLKDLAAKYKDNKGAPDMLVAKLKEGKGHPKAVMSDDDIKSVVGFVLTGK